jgi:hypothetical protein
MTNTKRDKFIKQVEETYRFIEQIEKVFFEKQKTKNGSIRKRKQKYKTIEDYERAFREFLTNEEYIEFERRYLQYKTRFKKETQKQNIETNITQLKKLEIDIVKFLTNKYRELLSNIGDHNNAFTQTQFKELLKELRVSLNNSFNSHNTTIEDITNLINKMKSEIERYVIDLKQLKFVIQLYIELLNSDNIQSLN